MVRWSFNRLFHKNRNLCPTYRLKRLLYRHRRSVFSANSIRHHNVPAQRVPSKPGCRSYCILYPGSMMSYRQLPAFDLAIAFFGLAMKGFHIKFLIDGSIVKGFGKIQADGGSAVRRLRSFHVVHDTKTYNSGWRRRHLPESSRTLWQLLHLFRNLMWNPFMARPKTHWPSRRPAAAIWHHRTGDTNAIMTDIQAFDGTRWAGTLWWRHAVAEKTDLRCL